MAILLLMLFWKCGFRLWPNGHAHTQCLNKKDFHLIHWWKWTTWASHVVSKVLPHSSLKRTCFLQKRNNNYRIIISNINNNSTKITATKINFHIIPFEPAVNMLWIFLFPPVKSEGKRKLEFYFWSRNVLPSLEPWGRRTAVPSLFPQTGQHSSCMKGPLHKPRTQMVRASRHRTQEGTSACGSYPTSSSFHPTSLAQCSGKAVEQESPSYHPEYCFLVGCLQDINVHTEKLLLRLHL